MIETVLLIALVVVALGMVGLILIQQGKGADAGASFGSGASQTFFGSSGSGNFLTHSTAILATIFFILCLSLAYIAREKAENSGRFDFDSLTTEAENVVPVSVEDVPVVDVTVSDIPASDAPVESETPVSADVPSVDIVEPAVAPASGE